MANCDKQSRPKAKNATWHELRGAFSSRSKFISLVQRSLPLVNSPWHSFRARRSLRIPGGFGRCNEANNSWLVHSPIDKFPRFFSLSHISRNPHGRRSFPETLARVRTLSIVFAICSSIVHEWFILSATLQQWALKISEHGLG